MTHNNVKLGILKLTSGILEDIIEGLKVELGLIHWFVLINGCKEVDFRIDENGAMRLCDRVCVPYVQELKKIILEEGHKSGLSIHIGATKMYQDLKMFWWPCM